MIINNREVAQLTEKNTLKTILLIFISCILYTSNWHKYATWMHFITLKSMTCFLFQYLQLLLLFLAFLFCFFFHSSVWWKYNCYEWHYLFSWVSWWISKLSGLLLACKSTSGKWNLHQFYCPSNRTYLWFHHSMVS